MNDHQLGAALRRQVLADLERGLSCDGRRLQGRRDLQLHNEGQIVTLNFEDGSPSKLQIQLAQLTYQNTRAAILKLTLLDQSTGKTIA